MKNVYFVQVNDFYGSGRKSTYIPYAVGCIQAFCLQDEVISSRYNFGRIVYCRDNIEDIVNRFSDPFMVLFSCSVWNTEFNKALAQGVKKAFPSCLITFGGHHVSSDLSFLSENPFVDFVVHNAGEEPTAALLRALALGENLEEISNLSFRRKNGSAFTTPILPQTGSDYPSPYLAGIFDDILKDDIDFSIILETNRGCPNACAFCDWGLLKSKVRLFPLERVFAELDWAVNHKIEYIYCADANFCLFGRDEQIIDYIIACNKQYGYPKMFHLNFTKNRAEFVFDVSSKLIKNGLSKAQTIAFQSMNPEVLSNIGRKNMSLENFRSLMRRFSENNIPTYCELILGLPGETYESFSKGLCSLIENGQHFAVYVYPCEMFPNSEISEKGYREKFKIGSTRVPFLLMHTGSEKSPGAVTEYVDIVTSTYSLNKFDWARTFLFACFVQGLHNMGLLRSVAIYCRYALRLSFNEFYEGLIDHAKNSSGSFLSHLYEYIFSLCIGVAEGKNSFVAPSEETNGILWGFEELVYIEVFKSLARFYEEVYFFLLKKFGRTDELNALFRYQFDIIKKIGLKDIVIQSDYDFYSYFNCVYLNSPQPLKKEKISLSVSDPDPVYSLADYARKAVWYGRNRRETDYTGGHYRVEYKNFASSFGE
ncbi:MAG: cobalamin-dependent protein [Oscillospiraceae bacterium]|nr:cobalamin-dependent protein [Oscillospiraceae bacterium]